MNETLRDVDTVILSHSHYDHAAGARPFIKQFHPQRLIVGKGFFQPKYAREKGIFTYLGCGFDQSFVKQENVNLVECNTTLALTSHLSIIGGFERYPEFDEPIPERFVIENEQGQFIKDTFKDEIALVYSHQDFLTLIVGCSHPGILSMITYTEAVFHKKVTRIFGGIHLNKAKKRRLEDTKAAFIKLGIEEVGLCHCSGEKINILLQKDNIIESRNVGCGDGFLL